MNTFLRGCTLSDVLSAGTAQNLSHFLQTQSYMNKVILASLRTWVSRVICSWRALFPLGQHRDEQAVPLWAGHDPSHQTYYLGGKREILPDLCRDLSHWWLCQASHSWQDHGTNVWSLGCAIVIKWPHGHNYLLKQHQRLSNLCTEQLPCGAQVHSSSLPRLM